MVAIGDLVKVQNAMLMFESPIITNVTNSCIVMRGVAHRDRLYTIIGVYDNYCCIADLKGRSGWIDRAFLEIILRTNSSTVILFSQRGA